MDLQLQVGLGRGEDGPRCASGCTLQWQAGKESAKIDRIARGVACRTRCRNGGAIDVDDGMGWDVAKDGSSSDLNADGRRVEEQFWRDSSSQQRHAQPAVVASVFRPAKTVACPQPLTLCCSVPTEPSQDPLATGRGALFFSDGPKPAAGDDLGISQAKRPLGFSSSYFETPAEGREEAHLHLHHALHSTNSSTAATARSPRTRDYDDTLGILQPRSSSAACLDTRDPRAEGRKAQPWLPERHHSCQEDWRRSAWLRGR